MPYDAPTPSTDEAPRTRPVRAGGLAKRPFLGTFALVLLMAAVLLLAPALEQHF